jgi:glc operon protein GlcG
MRKVLPGFTLLLILTLHNVAEAQAPAYGPSVTLEQAKKILVAAEAEANKNNWPVAIAVVDPAGMLVALHRLDNTQIGSILVAIEKGRTSAMFKRPSKAFEDAVAGGRNALLGLGVMPIEGGVPIMVDGKIIGAVGVSGVTAAQDAQVAKAGADAAGK